MLSITVFLIAKPVVPVAELALLSITDNVLLLIPTVLPSAIMEFVSHANNGSVLTLI